MGDAIVGIALSASALPKTCDVFCSFTCGAINIDLFQFHCLDSSKVGIKGFGRTK